MDHKLKVLTIEDLELLIEKYIEYYNSQGGKWMYDIAKIRLKQIILTPDSYGIGLFSNTELIGLAIGCFKQFDDIRLYYLEEILVFKRYQNKGWGTKILKELELLVKKQGAQKISLSTTYEDKHQRFYARLGYKKSTFLVPMSKSI